MNLIEKFHALLVSEDVTIWQFPAKREGPQFVWWPSVQTDDKHWCDSLEQMIEAAYAHIDPLQKPLPSAVSPPPGV